MPTANVGLRGCRRIVDPVSGHALGADDQASVAVDGRPCHWLALDLLVGTDSPVRMDSDIGLVRPEQGTNGYRLFREDHLHKLKFIGRARSLGFSLEECRGLMSLYEDRESAAAEARQIARHHIRRVEQKIVELQSMAATLQHLVALCDQGDRPESPILHDLAQVAQDQDTSSSRHFE